MCFCFFLPLSFQQVTLTRTLETTDFSGSVSELTLLSFPSGGNTQMMREISRGSTGISRSSSSSFSLLYLLALLGNTPVICAVWSRQKLHVPVHILLSNFSFLEICSVSSDVLNMLTNITSQAKSISYTGCLLQFYFSCVLLKATFSLQCPLLGSLPSANFCIIPPP